MSKRGQRLGELQERLGYHFADTGLLRLAVTHPSAGDDNYQRLEFLGDRVLGLIVAEHLLDSFPQEKEGEIARRYANLVCREIVAKVARDFELGRFLIVAADQEAHNRDRERILCDVMESVIAAIYLDGGFAAAATLVSRCWSPLVAANAVPHLDAKTALQEWAQGQGLALPCYAMVSREGPAHAPDFTVSVKVSGQPRKLAQGRTRRQAEQKAAAAVLAEITAG